MLWCTVLLLCAGFVITARCTIGHYCNCMSSICPSVRPSVTLVDHDHIGWKSWKLIARTISSPTSSLFVAQRPSMIHLLTGEHGEILGSLEVGGEKVTCWSTKATISLKRVTKVEEKLLWSAYRNSPTLCQTVPSPTPYGLLLPMIGASQPHPKTQNSNCYYRRNGWSYGLQMWPERSHANKSPLKIWVKGYRGHIHGLYKFFGYPQLSQDR